MNINEIEQRVLDAGSDNINVFGGRYEGGYHIQQSPKELAEFVLYLHNKNMYGKNYVEIGAAAAGLARFLDEIFHFENVTIIDLGVHHKIPIAFEENIKHIGNLHYIFCNSHSPEAKEFLTNLNINYDLVFQDGAYDTEGILKDVKLIKEFTNENVIICFHDTRSYRTETVRILKEENLHKEFIEIVDNNKTCGIGCFQF